MTTPVSRRYLAIWLPWLAEETWRSLEILPRRGRGTACEAGGGGVSRCREEDAPPPSPRDGPPTPAGEELVFTRCERNAVRLSALSRAAARAGLVPGLTLADARARVPGLVAVERDHDAEARLLGRITAGLARYTPMAAAEPPDGAVLDITGCTLPYRGEDGLAHDLIDRLAAGGVTARAGRGDTPQAARARARFGDAADLRDLPVAALEAAPEVIVALRRAGLRTVGDLAARPSTMLAARFGDLALRLARLLEQEDARITPHRPAPPVSAVRRFAEPIGRVEDALACLEELARQAAATLEQRRRGGRRFAARLFRCDGQVAGVTVETGRPTRDPALLIRLFRERVDALADPIDPGFGFDLVRLDVGGIEPLAPAQDALESRAAEDEALADLLDRLAARLGPGRIRRLAPRNSRIPECACAAVPAAATADWPEPEAEEPPLRPLRLLDPPQRVEAVLSEVPDGPPGRFRWAGATHVVRHHEGPERIAPEWWRRRDRGGRARDYYRVEDESGHRFWLFRHGLAEGARAADWYLHGLFA